MPTSRGALQDLMLSSGSTKLPERMASSSKQTGVIRVVITGYRFVSYSQVSEKDAKIRELTSKLRELEIAHSFMPSKPHLPKGYFSDLIDEDGLYD